MQSALKKSLSSRELEKLEGYLARIPQSMTMEMLDGFFAALVCSPKLVVPSVYMPHILGDDESNLSDLEDVKAFYELIIRHWNSISRTLHQGQPYDLVLIGQDDHKSFGNDWAVGFLRGVSIGGAAWSDLINDDEHGGIFVPIFALAHEHDPDPELRPNPIDDELRELMLASISAYLGDVYEYFAQHRRKPSMNSTAGSATSPRKIGRNEPCPCGGGRKYKHCCGSN